MARMKAICMRHFGGPETLELAEASGVVERGGRLISTLVEPDASKLAAHGIEGRHDMAEPNGAEPAEIASLMEAGAIRIVVSRSFSLAEAGEAERVLESEHPPGKLVLKIAA